MPTSYRELYDINQQKEQSKIWDKLSRTLSLKSNNMKPITSFKFDALKTKYL